MPSSPCRSSPATTARSTPPYRVVSTCCRARSCCALWTTSTESMLSLLTAELDWTLQFLPHVVTSSSRPPPTQPHCPLFMYLCEFDYSLAAVCAHHVISAAFHRDKRHSNIWVLVQGIQASWDVKLSSSFFFFPLSSGESLSTQRLDRWPFSSRSPQNLALLPAVYCKLQSHNLYFLKKKNITSNIY